jgi:hypothetical protein
LFDPASRQGRSPPGPGTQLSRPQYRPPLRPRLLLPSPRRRPQTAILPTGDPHRQYQTGDSTKQGICYQEILPGEVTLSRDEHNLWRDEAPPI